MKKLTLVEYGCTGTGYRNGSDVPNCRVRAEFDTLDGLHVVADFGGYQRHDANKKGVQRCSLTHYMLTAHITTLRVAGALMNIGLRKRDLIFRALISQEPEFWHL